jgi:hypothetical protein
MRTIWAAIALLLPATVFGQVDKGQRGAPDPVVAFQQLQRLRVAPRQVTHTRRVGLLHLRERVPAGLRWAEIKVEHGDKSVNWLKAIDAIRHQPAVPVKIALSKRGTQTRYNRLMERWEWRPTKPEKVVDRTSVSDATRLADFGTLYVKPLAKELSVRSGKATQPRQLDPAQALQSLKQVPWGKKLVTQTMKAGLLGQHRVPAARTWFELVVSDRAGKPLDLGQGDALLGLASALRSGKKANLRVGIKLRREVQIYDDLLKRWEWKSTGSADVPSPIRVETASQLNDFINVYAAPVAERIASGS